MNQTHIIDASINLEQARQDSLDLIKKRAFVSAGAATVPIPFFDLFADLGVLSFLLPEINEKFGLSSEHISVYNPKTKKVDWNALRKRGFELSSYVVARTAAKQSINGFVSRLLTKQVTKFIPLGGSVVAASLGYLLMKKIAEAHVEECYQTATRLRTEQNLKTVQSA